MSIKLLVKTPKTRNGITLVYDEKKQPVYKENLMELYAEQGLKELNAKLPEHLKHIITKVEVKEVGQQNSRIADLKKKLAELEAEKEEQDLLDKIAELEGKGGNKAEGTTKVKTVKELVEAILLAETVAQVNEIVGADERKGVIEARDKKIAELEGKA